MTDPLYALAKPLLFRLDAERAHHFILKLAQLASSSKMLCAIAKAIYAPRSSPKLEQQLLGLTFKNPIGLAAGLDKDGIAIDFWAAIGFGFVEVGTVTPGKGQPGNPTPRLARLKKDKALVNKMGFNNRGADALAERLQQRRTKIPVGANIGKAKETPLENAGEDYAKALRAVQAHVDYIAINVSSPNTPGLRDLQAVDTLRPLLRRITEENRAQIKQKPLLLKISPDLADEDLDRVADLALEEGIDGLIATNTTIAPPSLITKPPFQGGISGQPLTQRALRCTERIANRLQGRLPIVGVGGIASSADAFARIRAGASLLQVYSALIYEGPGLVKSVVNGLVARLESDGYSSLVDAIGASEARSEPEANGGPKANSLRR